MPSFLQQGEFHHQATVLFCPSPQTIPFPRALVPTPGDACPAFGHSRTRTPLRASRQPGCVPGQLGPQAKYLPAPRYGDSSVIPQGTSSDVCSWFCGQGRPWLSGLTYGNEAHPSATSGEAHGEHQWAVKCGSELRQRLHKLSH